MRPATEPRPLRSGVLWSGTPALTCASTADALSDAAAARRRRGRGAAVALGASTRCCGRARRRAGLWVVARLGGSQGAWSRATLRSFVTCGVAPIFVRDAERVIRPPMRLTERCCAARQARGSTRRCRPPLSWLQEPWACSSPPSRPSSRSARCRQTAPSASDTKPPPRRPGPQTIPLRAWTMASSPRTAPQALGTKLVDALDLSRSKVPSPFPRPPFRARTPASTPTNPPRAVRLARGGSGAQHHSDSDNDVDRSNRRSPRSR